MNEAGKITLLVFMPLAGVMILGTFYWVIFSDKVKESCAQRKERRKLKKPKKTKKVPDVELGVVSAT